MRWTVKCPESGKMVRDLYFVLRPDHTRFRSRHALGLSYRSNYLKPSDRYQERAWRVMDRLGVSRWAERPIRPKNMRRRIFDRLTDELLDARRCAAAANLGVLLARDELVNLGPAGLLAIVRKRDIALRRRRRKSSN